MTKNKDFPKVPSSFDDYYNMTNIIAFPVMKKTYLTVNHQSKVQILDGAHPDELLSNIILLSEDYDVNVLDFTLEDSKVTVDKEVPDFFNIDTRMKVVVEHLEDDLEDIINNKIQFEVEGNFVVWNSDIYGWGVENVK